MVCVVLDKDKVGVVLDTVGGRGGGGGGGGSLPMCCRGGAVGGSPRPASQRGAGAVVLITLDPWRIAGIWSMPCGGGRTLEVVENTSSPLFIRTVGSTKESTYRYSGHVTSVTCRQKPGCISFSNSSSSSGESYSFEPKAVDPVSCRLNSFLCSE